MTIDTSMQIISSLSKYIAVHKFIYILLTYNCKQSKLMSVGATLRSMLMQHEAGPWAQGQLQSDLKTVQSLSMHSFRGVRQVTLNVLGSDSVRAMQRPAPAHLGSSCMRSRMLPAFSSSGKREPAFELLSITSIQAPGHSVLDCHPSLQEADVTPIRTTDSL